MSNELLIVINIIGLYSAVLLWFTLFGIKGLYCFSIFATIVANIEVLILVVAFGLEQTLGNVLFATTFVVTDIVSELCGHKEAQKVVNINIATSVLFVLVTQCWLLYTAAESDFAMDSIVTLFSNTPRLVFASLIVYAVAQSLDVFLYKKWWAFTEKKFANKRKFLWVRNNCSTLISQLVNAVLYTLTAFYGVYDFDIVLSIMLTSYIIFVVTSFADTPVVYLARKINDRKLAKTVTD
ncbi:MAG: queuosine precursor transporter [Bacillota bacterium]